MVPTPDHAGNLLVSLYGDTTCLCGPPPSHHDEDQEESATSQFPTSPQCLKPRRPRHSPRSWFQWNQTGEVGPYRNPRLDCQHCGPPGCAYRHLHTKHAALIAHNSGVQLSKSKTVGRTLQDKKRRWADEQKFGGMIPGHCASIASPDTPPTLS